MKFKIHISFAAILVAFSLLALALIASTGNAQVPGQPTSLTTTAGKKVTITVAADGTQPFTYQWMKAKTVSDTPVDIPGATSSSFVMQSVTPADSGIYTVKVSNAAGFAISNTATLILSVPPTTGGMTITITAE